MKTLIRAFRLRAQPTKHLIWAALACLGPLAAIPTYASYSYYLKVDGIDGEAAFTGHTDEIEVLSWSWGETRANSALASTMSDVTFTMKTSKASPKLFQACAAGGKPIASAVLTAITTTPRLGSKSEYLSWKFKNLLITAYQTKNDPSAGFIDQISFNFTSIQIIYYPPNANGTLAPVTAGWDLVKQVAQVASVSDGNEGSSPAPLPKALENMLGPAGATTDTLRPHEEVRNGQRYLAFEVVRSKNQDGSSLNAETSENLKEWFGGGVIEEVLSETDTTSKVQVLLPIDQAQKFFRWRTR